MFIECNFHWTHGGHPFNSNSIKDQVKLEQWKTKQTKYYEIPGATEYSAMNSAEGEVQNLRYKATFPLLLNIKNEPTYFIALKDNENLVKMYSMVNVGQYQIVAKGQTLLECEKDYIKNSKPNGYRSYHIILGIPVYCLDGMEYFPVEIQFRTMSMDFWASMEHRINYKKE